ncbi:MAG: flagellar protein FlgN [Candidatus Marinimicrobia bacterium]|nr:flagellar protein FlgN [Candidatus Neomarinimicrobiota bacterium]
MNKNKAPDQFNKLIQSLEQEIELFSEMSETIQKKQKAIISGEVEELREYVASEKEYIEKSMDLAKQRKNIQMEISSKFNLDYSKPKLKTIIEIAPPDQSIKLSNLRYRLEEILNAITRINNENKLLLNFSIEHVKGMARLFLNIDEEDHEVYGITGIKRAKQTNNKMLDFQI